MAKIVFTFPRDGTVKIEPQGYGGTLCKTVTQPYLNALGGKVLVSADTAEASAEALQAATEQQKEHIAGG